MGQYIRWQAIIAFVGVMLLIVYLNSISIVETTVVVPAEGGVYREGVVGSIQYLNPLLATYNPVDQDITHLIFEGLTVDNGLGNLEPQLAQNWSISVDGQTYVFVLRQDVKWSDGTQFTSDDVLFTLQLIQSPDFPGNPAWKTLWQNITIEQVDKFTLRFVLTEPFPSFMHYTTIGILPKHLLKDISAQDLLNHPFNLSPIGTGPFKLQTATSQHVTLVRNSRYYQKPSRIEQIEFKFYPDFATIYQAFKNKEIDGTNQIPLKELNQLKTQTKVQLYNAPLPRYNIVYFNLQQPETLPFFQDNTIRQALIMAINRQSIIDEVLNGQAIPANIPLLPWQWAYNPTQTYITYNPTKAAELLDTTTWQDTNADGIRDNNGISLKFNLIVSPNPIQIQVANHLSKQWQKIGVSTTVEVVDNNLDEYLTTHQFEAALIEIEAYGDPDPYRFWHQTQIDEGQNFAGWDNLAASIALEQGRLALKQDERIKHYYNFQQIFAEEVPALVLYYPIYSYALSNTVKNVQLSPITTPADRFRNIEAWYLLTQQIIKSAVNPNFSP